MSGMHAAADVLGRVCAAVGRLRAARMAVFSGGAAAHQPRRPDVARAGARTGRRDGRAAASRAARCAARRGVHPRRHDAELRRTGGRRQERLCPPAVRRGVRAVSLGSATVQARRDGGGARALPARRLALRLQPVRPRDGAPGPALDADGRARDRRGGRARRLGRRLRPVQAARAVARAAPQRARRSHPRLRARRRRARRSARSPAAWRQRRHADRSHALSCTCRKPSAGVSPSCARRTMRSRTWRACPRRRSTAWAAASSACCGCCGGTGCCGSRRSARARWSPGSTRSRYWATRRSRGSATTPRSRSPRSGAARSASPSLVLFAGGIGLALVFMAAESLSRRAFPHHPQLWRIWSRDAAPTRAVLGRTLGGYLFVPIELALIAGFYFVTNTYFGWWQPSESLSDPNILGSAPSGAGAHRQRAAGRLHGGVPVPRRAAVARGAHRRTLRLPPAADRRGARRRRRWSSPPRTRTIPASRPTRAWSSSSGRR